MERSAGAGGGGGDSRPVLHGTAAAALLAAVILLYFAPVLAGRIALPFDMLYHIDPAFRGVPGAPPTPEPLNVVSGWDRVYQFHPWFLHNVRSLRRGEIPLWNPHAGAGSPHLALDITAVFDPLSTGAGLIVGGERAGTARVVLSALLAALGMLVLMRSRGASAAAGVLAGLSFALGGWFILWLGRPLTSAAAWLPWMLWAATRLARRGRPAGDGALLALFVALSLLAGHIATTAHALLLTGALLACDAVRLRTGPRAITAAAGTGLAFIALGVLAAAIVLLPFLEFLLGEAGGVGIRAGPPQSFGGRLLEGLGGRVSAQAVSGTLLTSLVPVLNFPGTQRFTSPPPSLAEVTIYVGVVPLLLAGYALARSRRAERWFWAAAAVAALALALRLPVFHLVNRLSIVGWTGPDRLRLVWSLSIAVLAGLGLDALAAGRAGARDRAWPLSLLLHVPGAWAAWLLGGADAEALRRGLAGIIAGVIALGAWGLLRPARLRWALVAITGLELTAALHGVQPTLPAAAVFPTPPLVAFLDSAGGGRVAPLPVGAMRPLGGGLTTAYEIDSVEGYNVLHSARLRSLYAAANGDIRWAGAAGRDWLTLDDPSSPLVDLLGVRWLLTAAISDPAVVRGARIPAQFPRLAWTDGHAAAWENPDPMPRAFVVRHTSPAGDDGPARLLSPDFDFRRRALVDRPVALPPAPADAAPARVALRREASGRIAIDVAQEAPGLLVVTESWDPGWRATVDGAAAEVVIADVAFLGVIVPAGRHEVRLRYAPASFRWGILVTLLTAGALIGGALLERARPRGRRPPGDDHP
ncbi:MAG TPA: YfhO family protein [Longimicrobiales bacterium]|nr:YfhO family protein [Longimicrobiales bacterium]